MLSTSIFYSGYNILFGILSLFIGIGSVFLIRNSRDFRSMLLFQLGGLAMIFLTYITTQDHFLYALGLNYKFAAFAQILTALVISVFWINAATDFYNYELANRESLTVYITLALTLCIYFAFAAYNASYITILRQMFPLIGVVLLFIISVIKLFKRVSAGYFLLCISLFMLGEKLLVSAFFYQYSWLNLNLFNWLWLYIFAAAMVFMAFDMYKEDLQKSWNMLDKLGQQIADMIETSPLPTVVVKAKDKKFMVLNDKASALFGISRKEQEYHKLDDLLIDARNYERFKNSLEEKGKTDNFDVMICNLINGEPFWMSAAARYIDYKNENAIFITFQDIAYRKEREDNLQNRANKDPLTLVWNRRYFEKIVPEKIAECIQNLRNFSLLLLDADRFKKINDKFGHQSGDKVLIELAEICRSSLREDDIVARFGGEEFVIFLNDADKNAAQHVAERLRQNVEKTEVKIEDEAIKFTVSIGVVSSEKTASLEILLRQVDEAMYLAKRGGRNQVAMYDEEKIKSRVRKTKNTKRNMHPVFENEENEEISLLGNYDNKLLQE